MIFEQISISAGWDRRDDVVTELRKVVNDYYFISDVYSIAYAYLIIWFLIVFIFLQTVITSNMSSLDEANIFIEQLEESLKSSINEKDRDKKKYSQQLIFMESENADLQTKLTDRNEKYFDDKKKYNAKINYLYIH